MLLTWWQARDWHNQTQPRQSGTRLDTVRSLLARRRRCVRKLIAQIRRERRLHAQHDERQSELIATLRAALAEQSRLGPESGREAEVVEGDLQAALTMLDEVEMDACRTREALDKVAEMKAEVSVQAQIIANLEEELAASRRVACDAN